MRVYYESHTMYTCHFFFRAKTLEVPDQPETHSDDCLVVVVV